MGGLHTAVRLYIIILWTLVGMETTMGQVYASYDYQDVDYTKNSNNYNYGYGGGGGGGYDYGGGGGGDYSFDESDYGTVISKKKFCYACHYSWSPEHEQGEPNCNEPFIQDGIPVVECEGRCAKAKTVLDKGSFMLVRSCLPQCKDLVEPESIVKCCHGSKCNDDRSAADTLSFSFTFSFLHHVTLYVAILFSSIQ